MHVEGDLDVLDASLVFLKFAYPVSNLTGRLRFDRDPQTNRDRLQLLGLRGRGMPGSANADATLRVEGVVSPLDHTSGVDITIRGERLVGDAALRDSLPVGVRRVLQEFDADGNGLFPTFEGSFTCRTTRTAGDAGEWNTQTDIDVQRSSGMLQSFRYPLKDVSAKIRVTDDAVEISDAKMPLSGGEATLSGTFRLDEDVRTPLTLRATGVPIDAAMIAALPPAAARVLEQLGASGHVDLGGTIGIVPHGDADFDFEATVREATLRPLNGPLMLTAVNVDLHVGDRDVTVKHASARRGQTAVTASGRVDMPAVGPSAIDLTVSATVLPLDKPLAEIAPAQARAAWDRFAPSGVIDLSVRLQGDAADPAVAWTLTPRQLSAQPAPLAAPLSEITGTLSGNDQAVELRRPRDELRERPDRGERQVRPCCFGAGRTAGVGDRSSHRRAFSRLVAAIDRRAAARSGAQRGDFRGELSRLTFAPDNGPVGFEGTISTHGGSFVAGLLLSDIDGAARLRGEFRDGRLDSVEGDAVAKQFSIEGRVATDARSKLRRLSGERRVVLSDIEARLGDGELAGTIECTPPDHDDGRYAMSLLLRDSELKRLTSDVEPDSDGRLTASFSLEGDFRSTRSRRGRGDVLVTGKKLHRVPLLLGLLQITNLSLPINEPFTRGQASYSIAGEKLAIESLELSSASLNMNGTGMIDFAAKTVSMTLHADASAWAKIPLLGDVISGCGSAAEYSRPRHPAVADRRSGLAAVDHNDGGSGHPRRMIRLCSAMRFATLGSTGLNVSVVGVGTWQFGGEWGTPPTQEHVDAIFEAARDCGINLIDTAECYGDHLSESFIGRATEKDRDRWVIATKVGHKYHGPFDRTEPRRPEDVRDQVEQSLRRYARILWTSFSTTPGATSSSLTTRFFPCCLS